MLFKSPIVAVFVIASQLLALLLGPAVFCQPSEGAPRVQFAGQICCPDEDEQQPSPPTTRCRPNCIDTLVTSVEEQIRPAPNVGEPEIDLCGVYVAALDFVAVEPGVGRVSPLSERRWPPWPQAQAVASIIILC